VQELVFVVHPLYTVTDGLDKFKNNHLLELELATFQLVAFLLLLFIFYYYLFCEANGTAATPGLLCQPRVIVKMIVEKQMECRLCRGNRSSRRKPSPAPLLSITKSHMTRPELEPGPPCWETGTNRLSYGAAQLVA
jgi:hypothetical protein